MKMESAIALARRFTGTVSRMSVFTGPVERNSRNMALARHTIDAVLSFQTKAKVATGTALKDNVRKISQGTGQKVYSAVEGLKLIAEGKEIKYSGASGPCKFADNGNIIEIAFRTTQVKDGKLVEVKS